MGLLNLAMQTTEELFDIVLIMVFPGKQRMTLEVLERLERERRSRTLGRLIKQMRDRVALRPDLEELLNDFVLHRNQFTHRLRDVPGWDLDSVEGRKVAWRFLSQVHAENQTLMEVFFGFLMAWVNQNELKIEGEVLARFHKSFPEVPKYAAMIDDLVFPK